MAPTPTYTNEVDQLTAQVVLGSGQHTNQISVDLRDGKTAKSGPAKGEYYNDFMDCIPRPTPIQVSTFIEGRTEPASVIKRNTIKINVNVQQLGGKKKDMEICISPKSTVIDLKQKIQEKTTVFAGDFWLQYGRVRLDDTFHLYEYGLKNESHVTAKILRTRGG